jgi:hypothetical protein
VGNFQLKKMGNFSLLLTPRNDGKNVPRNDGKVRLLRHFVPRNDGIKRLLVIASVAKQSLLFGFRSFCAYKSGVLKNFIHPKNVQMHFWGLILNCKICKPVF